MWITRGNVTELHSGLSTGSDERVLLEGVVLKKVPSLAFRES